MFFGEYEFPDKVTKLPHYDEFLSLAEKMVSDRPDPTSDYFIISVDIYNFKIINQLYGYPKGDELLRSFALHAIKNNSYCLLACRPYSDHFYGICAIPKKLHADPGLILMDYINDFINANQPFFPSIVLHMNCGICKLADSQGVVDCIDKANIARRSIKRDNGTAYSNYSNDMLISKEQDAAVTTAFLHALEHNSIKVCLQPKVDSKTHKLIGAEALSRIPLEDGSLLPPGLYVPILEKSSNILKLDWYMIHSVFSLIGGWLRRGITPVPISINLSKLHFYSDGFAHNVYNAFCEYNIPADYIEFEITESLFEKNSYIMKELEILRSYGFKISMDDFGTGYSTLHMLGTLPIDIVKFDRLLVHSSMSSKKSLDILKGLMTIFKDIDLSVICEGVETEEEEEVVNRCGCCSIQGFLYDKPIGVNDFEGKYMALAGA